MKDTYYYETCSTTGEISKYAKDLEFNGIVYGPRMNRDSKGLCMMEASMIRTTENRRARAVLMDDGEWYVYASYAKNNE